MEKQKRDRQYVFSARTTEKELNTLNGLKAKLGVGWDTLVIDAVCPLRTRQGHAGAAAEGRAEGERGSVAQHRDRRAEVPAEGQDGHRRRDGPANGDRERRR